MKVLLVEDDRAISVGLSYTLEQEGYEVVSAFTAAQAREAMAGQAFDLALMDLMLPDGSGYQLCEEIKRQGDTAVIFLTACDEEINAVMGLDMGGDDYITKPFRVKELLSRIRSVLRRVSRSAPEVVQLGDVSVQPQHARVFKGGEEVALTAMEYRLLLALIRNAGQVFTRAQLLEEIWDVAGDFVNDNTLTVYIKRLREKLEDDPQSPQIIQTVRGLGYKVVV